MEWWQQLLLAVGAAVVGGGFFYLLQLRRLGSVARERLSRAYKELVDTIEIDVINEQEISRDIIFRLIKATSRAYNVDLERVCSPISLCEDVELQLQTNKYLETNKKHAYVNRIRIAIENMQAPEAPTPEWPPEAFKKLKADIIGGNKEEALQIIETLSKQPYIPEMKFSELIKKSEARQAQLVSMMVGVAMGIIGVVIAVVLQLVTR